MNKLAPEIDETLATPAGLDLSSSAHSLDGPFGSQPETLIAEIDAGGPASPGRNALWQVTDGVSNFTFPEEARIKIAPASLKDLSEVPGLEIRPFGEGEYAVSVSYHYPDSSQAAFLTVWQRTSDNLGIVPVKTIGAEHGIDSFDFDDSTLTLALVSDGKIRLVSLDGKPERHFLVENVLGDESAINQIRFQAPGILAIEDLQGEIHTIVLEELAPVPPSDSNGPSLSSTNYALAA